MKIIPPIRGNDEQGSGYFGAPRGEKTHRGVDLACHKGSIVLSLTPGFVTKIGFPYDPSDRLKGHLRYVQVTYDETNYRYFYIYPTVKLGNTVEIDEPLGIVQGLTKIYHGITDHFHLEITRDGIYLDPTKFLESVD